MRVFVFILFLLPSISFAQTKDYKTYDKAVKYYKNKNYDKAIQLSLKLIQENFDWDNPHLLLSSIYANKGEIDLSASYLLNIYDEEDPNDIEGIEEIAKLLYNNGRYDRSRYYFNKLLELDSTLVNKNIDLVKDIYGRSIYKLSVEKILKNCIFATQAIKQPVPFNAYNMGENINSEFAEYLPTISANNNLFFITRRLEYEDGSRNEDFFISIKTEDGTWSNTTRLDKPINSNENEGALTLSSDGYLLVFTACDRRNSYGGCDLYFSYKTNKWSIPYNLGEHINSKQKDTQPCFSSDGKYLYFASNRKGGYGGLDIWKTEVGYNNYGSVSFKEPENLGPTINTKYNEMSPFIHTDNLTLYFASDGHIGMGNYDLFISRRSDIENEWMTPKNLGYPINTYKKENSLIVSSDGKTAYYASDVSGFGKEDIFWFELPENIQAEHIADFELEIITRKAGEEVVLKNVQFDHNSYTLRTSSFIELHKLIAYLHKDNSLKISIEGHTDNVGDTEENKLLSENRAKTVYDYLLEKGVSPSQLASYSGYGENKPISNNDTKNGRALNRRTSFRISH